MKPYPALAILAAFTLAAVMAAQAPATVASTAPATSQANASPSTTTSTAPANNPPSLAGPTPPDLAAARNLAQEMNNPKSAAAQVQRDIQTFEKQYPASKSRLGIDYLAMQYFRERGMMQQEIAYGQQALKTQPHFLLVLIQLATVIPVAVRPTDLNRDQMLNQAQTYAQQALALAHTEIKPGAGNPPMTAAQAAFWKKAIHAAAESAYGRIAADRGQAALAVTDFQKAVALDSPAGAAQDYFRMGVQQENLHQYPDALNSLHMAASMGANNATLQTLVQAEIKRIQRKQTPATSTTPPGAPTLTPHF